MSGPGHSLPGGDSSQPGHVCYAAEIGSKFKTITSIAIGRLMALPELT
jgi:hypothetical protein